MRTRTPTLLAALVVIAACSRGRSTEETRASAPASPTIPSSTVASPTVESPTVASSAVATPVATAAPLAHDSVVTSTPDTGVRVGADGRLLLPIVFAESCEGEGCETSFRAVACATLDLRSAADSAAPVVARLARGDSVHVSRTDLHVARPGIVVVKQRIVRASERDMDSNEPMPRQDTLRFAPGDTVYLLQYEQLGWWLYWWKGKTTDGEGFWGIPADDEALGVVSDDTSLAVARSQPVIERWWLLDDGKHPIGWWRADSARYLPSVSRVPRGEDQCPASGRATGE